MASVPGMLVIPTNTWRFGPGLEVSGIAGAGLDAGDCVVTTDGITWTLAGAEAVTAVGVVMEDPVKGNDAFTTGAMITVRIAGGCRVVSTASILAEGDLLETAASGLVAISAEAAAADIAKTIGRAITAVDASGGELLMMLRWR